MNLTANQRDALEMLAGAPHGLTEELLVFVYHFDRDVLAGLVRDGLISARRHTGKAGGEMIEVVRMKITEAGREALKPR